MKNHQIIFDKIKNLLSEKFGGEIKMYEEETHLVICESEIWISMDDDELTIGYGMNHRHYHHEYDDINEAIDMFFTLLTGRKRITKYYKGKYEYKNKIEIEKANGEYKELGTSMTWLFPYWKKSDEKIEVVSSLIDYNEIEEEIVEIKNLVKR